MYNVNVQCTCKGGSVRTKQLPSAAFEAQSASTLFRFVMISAKVTLFYTATTVEDGYLYFWGLKVKVYSWIMS